MSEVITAVCGRCLHRVDAAELDNPEKKCDHCRGVATDPHAAAAADAFTTTIELLDTREFDGGAHLAECDEP